jgi:hypothetical protein
MTPPPLGDSFSKDYKETFCNNHLIPGAVLRFFSRHTKPPKEKLCVVVAITKDSVSLALNYINTKPPLNPHLQPWQLFLAHRGREEYLNHDSYLDCAQLYEENLGTVRKLLLEDIGIYKGQLLREDFKKVRNLVASAKTITPELKKKYGLR